MSQSTDVDFTTRNHILNSIAKNDLARLRPVLEKVELPHGLILYESGATIGEIYFPDDAVVSVVTATLSGHYAEAGLIGWEGMSGVEAMFDGPISLNQQIIQLPGHGHRVELGAVKAEFALGGSFQKAALAFTRNMLAQTSQTALCNRLHVAEQRLAKWLLMLHDRASSDVLNITQEFAALMLGSNRVTLTQAARQLQEHGMIEYRRGVVTILNRELLESFSCECYQKIKEEFDRYLATSSGGVS
ncbi:MAG TPA: Crp/Fnr family transcriptional regulator [Pyrinomonadaceae bacterium]